MIIMAEETNDMKPADPEKILPASLGRQLGNLMTEKELDVFRDQLPDAFLSDASEGLSQVRDDRQLDAVLKHLNHHMHQELKTKKKRLVRRPSGDLSWSYWAILIILLLTICTFIVIRMFLHH